MILNIIIFHSDTHSVILSFHAFIMIFCMESICMLSKYHSQKLESTRRTIFNRDPTLQHFVQISSGSVNSSVRARAKTYGSTPVSIELPRGSHLGSKCLHLLGPDACIIGAPMPSSLHKSAQQEALDAYIFMFKSTIQRCARRHVIRASKDTRVATSCARPRDTRVGLLARVQEDARVGHVIRASAYGARPKIPALDTSSSRRSLA